MVMRHSPERESTHSIFAKHSPLHKKATVARDRGAIGIIFISQIEDDGLFPLNYIKSSSFKACDKISSNVIGAIRFYELFYSYINNINPNIIASNK